MHSGLVSALSDGRMDLRACSNPECIAFPAHDASTETVRSKAGARTNAEPLETGLVGAHRRSSVPPRGRFRSVRQRSSGLWLRVRSRFRAFQRLGTYGLVHRVPSQMHRLAP